MYSTPAGSGLCSQNRNNSVRALFSNIECRNAESFSAILGLISVSNIQIRLTRFLYVCLVPKIILNFGGFDFSCFENLDSAKMICRVYQENNGLPLCLVLGLLPKKHT